MRIYIAGRYSRKLEFRDYADTLTRRGHHVTSRWLQETASPDAAMGEESPTAYAGYATVDLEDIDNSDSLLFFSEDPLVGTPRGGRHVEFGYALAGGKFIDVVGPAENIFHYRPMVHHYASFEEYLAAQIQEVTFGV
jgi:hypothetical protein